MKLLNWVFLCFFPMVRRLVELGERTRDAIDGVGVEQRVEPSQHGGVVKECGT